MPWIDVTCSRRWGPPRLPHSGQGYLVRSVGNFPAHVAANADAVRADGRKHCALPCRALPRHCARRPHRRATHATFLNTRAFTGWCATTRPPCTPASRTKAAYRRCMCERSSMRICVAACSNAASYVWCANTATPSASSRSVASDAASAPVAARGAWPNPRGIWRKRCSISFPQSPPSPASWEANIGKQRGS